MPQKVRKQKRRNVIITIKRLGINGEGLGYYRKKIIFIPGALPDEVVVAAITKSHPHYLEAQLIRIKKRSPERQPFPKGVDPRTGGLELVDLNYQQQLVFKKNNLLEALQKYKPKGFANYKVEATIAAPQIFHYRNKAQYQIERQHGKTRLGLFMPHSHHLLDLPIMPTQSEATQKVEREIKHLVDQLHVSVANFYRKRPGLKTIVVRQTQASKEIQVTLITIGHKLNQLKQLTDRILHLPHVVSIYQNETEWQNPQVWGNKTTHLAGKKQIIETLLGRKFALSPQAFFQLNTRQAGRLYQEALKLLDLTPDQTLIDAYGGVGTLGILAASKVKQVIGIETIPAAVKDANHNAVLNHLKNVNYLQGRAEEVLPELKKAGIPLNALIVDPPRTGLAKKVIKTLLQAGPQTFVYISCNPSTLAQNLVLLTSTYKVQVIKNIDMFPQTPKCECIVKLSRR